MKFHLSSAVLFLAVFGTGCPSATFLNSSGSSSTSGTSSVPTTTLPPPPLQTVTVQPLYPVNGANWNDYIRNSNSAQDMFHQNDVACNGTESSASMCLHAGELRQVTYTGANSCSGLSIFDALGAFDWTCRSTAGGVVFFSKHLIDTKGLGDLVSSTSWLQNSVTIQLSGSTVAFSNPSSWWTNTVLPAPPNASGVSDWVALNTASAIYTVSASTNSRGYLMTAAKVALVTLPGSTLTWALGGSTFCDNSGSYRCLVSLVGNFGWIEGTYDGGGADYTVDLFSTNFSRVRRLGAVHGNYGLYMNSAGFNTMTRIRASFSVNTDLYMIGSNHNRLSQMSLSDSPSAGAWIVSSSYNTFVGIVAANNSYVGMTVSVSTNANTFSHLTFANNSTGFTTWAGSVQGVFASQILAVNNGYGFSLSSTSPPNYFAQIATANNSVYGIDLGTSTGSVFSGNLLTGSNGSADCNTTAGPPAGLTSSCSPNGSSTSNLTSSISLAGSVVGKATSDALNTSQVNGLAPVGSLDFFNFLNGFRAWGTDGSAFPFFNNQGYCSSGNCRIWDWRLSSGDTMVLNRSQLGNAPNSPFIGGSACPAAADGNQVLTDAQGQTYLLNAVEIPGEPFGNDNGLCESGETCIYSPNFGAYQGEGIPSGQSCVFHDGAVTGVTLYNYAANGG